MPRTVELSLFRFDLFPQISIVKIAALIDRLVVVVVVYLIYFGLSSCLIGPKTPVVLTPHLLIEEKRPNHGRYASFIVLYLQYLTEASPSQAPWAGTCRWQSLTS